MATQKLVTGATAYASNNAFGSTDLNSLANAAFKMSTVEIDNSTNLDMFADVSFSLGSITPGTNPSLTLYLIPVGYDGTTYPTNNATLVSSGYQALTLPLPAGAAVQTGTFRAIPLPVGKFKFGLLNNSGVTLAASANVVEYRTWNYSVA